MSEMSERVNRNLFYLLCRVDTTITCRAVIGHILGVFGELFDECRGEFIYNCDFAECVGIEEPSTAIARALVSVKPGCNDEIPSRPKKKSKAVSRATADLKWLHESINNADPLLVWHLSSWYLLVELIPCWYGISHHGICSLN
jgi:hypothetical protein